MENTLRDKIITLDTLKDSLLNNHCLEGKSELGSARIKFSQMAPYIVLCQHSGTFISENIVKKMSVSSDIRSYETDMYLDQLCNEQPIEIIAVHSRYEFDTNRFEKGCIYSKPSLAWGVKVYNETLNQDEISTIISKYREFYTYINLIITSIIDKYGVCVIYDLHSFNETHPDRLNKDLPLINLGTMAQNTEKFRVIIDLWLNELKKITITDVVGKITENDIFGGRGGMAYHISHTFPEALVFPTEFRKFYMNERTLELYNDRFLELQKQLNEAIYNHSKLFAREMNINNWL